MYLIFYKTNDVFAAEELLQAEGIAEEVVPTPVQDKAYCGVCLKINKENWEQVKELLCELEYQAV